MGGSFQSEAGYVFWDFEEFVGVLVAA